MDSTQMWINGILAIVNALAVLGITAVLKFVMETSKSIAVIQVEMQSIVRSMNAGKQETKDDMLARKRESDQFHSHASERINKIESDHQVLRLDFTKHVASPHPKGGE